MIRTVTIDTLTAILDKLYMESETKPTHDDWFDWGKTVWKFISDLQNLGFEIILVIGDPGTGKSTGMMTLPTKTNIWFNADNKNPVWKGGKVEYGTKLKPTAPFHVVTQYYDDIISHIVKGINKGQFEEQRYAILTGHTEEYKGGGNITKQRLKVIGKVATKMQIEARLENVFYSKVIMENGKPTYKLETQNNGFNTARSPMEAFPLVIPNDYNLIVNTLLRY